MLKAQINAQVGKQKENFQLSNQHELLGTTQLRERRAHDCVGFHSKDVTLDARKFLFQQGKGLTSFQHLPWRSSYRSQSFFPFEDVALVAKAAIWGKARVHAAWPLTSILKLQREPRGYSQGTLPEVPGDIQASSAPVWVGQLYSTSSQDL